MLTPSAKITPFLCSCCFSPSRRDGDLITHWKGRSGGQFIPDVEPAVLQPSADLQDVSFGPLLFARARSNCQLFFPSLFIFTHITKSYTMRDAKLHISRFCSFPVWPWDIIESKGERRWRRSRRRVIMFQHDMSGRLAMSSTVGRREFRRPLIAS